MILVKTAARLNLHLSVYLSAGKNIGFVPTMGALHRGHISLIERSEVENEVTVCSIFVNPAQFSNAEDLQKYPVTIEQDINALEKAGCDLLFLPSVIEMYPADEKPDHYDLGYLENILEGKFRPDHFQGVCRIVDKLLAAVKPNVLYLGRKDYQQCMVIKQMMQARNYKAALRICDTVREPDGLAMSSRNLRLDPAERDQAVKIIESLMLIKNKLRPGNLSEIKNDATLFLEKNGYKVDYAEIANAETLISADEWNGKTKNVALVAAYINDIRLIDNLVL